LSCRQGDRYEIDGEEFRIGNRMDASLPKVEDVNYVADG
jgi:hypothetical protein